MGKTIAIVHNLLVKRSCRGAGGGGYVAHLNFKTSRVGVYKSLSLIVGFAVTVAIWLRGVVSCGDFVLRAVATFWALSLVGIFPGRALANEVQLQKVKMPIVIAL